MISVCMATYNGEKWIEAQLESILSQLQKEDEVVLVDDGSSDSTLEKVKQLADPRIHIIQNEKNLGVDKTFEKALMLARGSILFLSDQDDIWYPGKVRRILQEFDKYPTITLALSDAKIIDAEDKEIKASYFDDRGKFIPGIIPNIAKSKFLGCAIAVKSNMRGHFLPFPEKIPGHDMWIGLVNEYYGKTHFIPEALIGYRRHGKNLSPESRQNLKKMLIWRWQLISGLVKRVWKLSFQNRF